MSNAIDYLASKIISHIHKSKTNRSSKSETAIQEGYIKEKIRVQHPKKRIKLSRKKKGLDAFLSRKSSQ